MGVQTDAREGNKEAKEPTFEEQLLAQNAQILNLLEGIFWILGGPMVAGVSKQQYKALLKEQEALAAQQKAAESKIVSAASMKFPGKIPQG